MFLGSGEFRANAVSAVGTSLNFAGQAVDVTPGDILTAEVWQNSGANLDLNAGVFWAGARTVPGPNQGQPSSQGLVRAGRRP